MNNKAQTGGISIFGFSVLTGIIIFLVGMSVVNIIIPEIDNARSSTALDCTNPMISDGTKLTCLTVDSVIPYYIILIFAAAGGIITYKMLS